MKYLHLRPDDLLPVLATEAPFKALVLIEVEVPQIWQWDVSRWLVSSGCRTMLAWGKDCSAWAESVDEANLERFNYEDVPEDQLVMTTWHDDEELSEVFWFAKHRAAHPAHELREVFVVHISDAPRQEELAEMLEDA